MSTRDQLERHVLTDELLNPPPCDCASFAPEVIQIGELVHLVCPGCARDLDWPQPIAPSPAPPRVAPPLAEPMGWDDRCILAAVLVCAALGAGCLLVAGWAAAEGVPGTPIIALASAVPMIAVGLVVEVLRRVCR